MSSHWGREIVGRAVKVMVGEPWDFASSAGENRLHAVIEDSGGAGEEEWLFLRVTPFTYEGIRIRYLLAVVRHVGFTISHEMMTKAGASVNLVYDRQGTSRTQVLALAKKREPTADEVGWLIGSVMPPDEFVPRPEDI